MSLTIVVGYVQVRGRCLLGDVPAWMQRSASGGAVVVLLGWSWRVSGLGRVWPPWTHRRVGGPDLGESFLGVASGFRGCSGYLARLIVACEWPRGDDG